MSTVRFDALYGRQSIDKKDSISIESQLEFCRYETHGGAYREYTDKGYSGKNTDRPDFNRMMNDVRAGRVARVIVYKLDRISRSILDFANMMEEFQQYDVEFVSGTEKFDTSTPIGRAMLNICIVFAQLERETIQKRTSDAYHSRAARGFFMGGDIPYGFRRVPHTIEGKKTARLEAIPEEIEQVKFIYRLYADEIRENGKMHTIYTIVTYLAEHGIKNLRGNPWNENSIASILGNPAYAISDLALYEFFKGQGSNIVNPVEEWENGHGCYLYRPVGSPRGATTMKTYKDKTVVLAPHMGVIASDTWIRVRTRSLNHQTRATSRGARQSWLVGKLKCGYCGHALVVATSHSKNSFHRYMQCSFRYYTRKVGCNGFEHVLLADEVEQYVFREIKKKLATFDHLEGRDARIANPKVAENKMRIAQIDEEIEALAAKVGFANEALLKSINERTEKLDATKRELLLENVTLESFDSTKVSSNIFNHVESWDDTSIDEKERVVDILIDKIVVTDDTMDIIWNV